MAKNTTLSETGHVFVTLSSDLTMLHTESSKVQSVTLSDIVITMDHNESIEYEVISSAGGTSEGSVGISKSKIPVE